MANPHPTPRLENLRPPWQPGTSGNPAGYSQGRRISDAMEGLIDELGLQREFATVAIAMALGQKHLLKQKVTDPETGQDVWVEQQPDLAWFQMIEQRLEPAAQQRDADARLRAILDDIDREDPDPVDQGKAAQFPWRPGPRFRCFIRCLHRKGPRMASRPQRRKPENRNPQRIGLLNLLRPPSKVHAPAPSVTPEPALVNHAEKSANKAN